MAKVFSDKRPHYRFKDEIESNNMNIELLEEIASLISSDDINELISIDLERIEFGVITNENNVDGYPCVYSPLCRFIGYKRPFCVQFYTPLMIASHMGYVNIVKILLGIKGVDPNLKNDEGLNPLILASYFRHDDVIEALMGDDRIISTVKYEWKWGLFSVLSLKDIYEGVPVESPDVVKKS